ncbi:ubiquinol-cytochrome C chaperone family protein [Kordiimonas sp. SCSIO 12610]|uniref:ubiquinol-cytochrome C chaperone family protein n=1 Tax=Kordiimonas sp. SCSIO 12610 TaxID=2829597 RepID=UPI00210957EB|nr:ubiquinol-cytochrome C chaperone family protein [Kordiimonas sp. SCSIO 12610]
MIKRWLENRKMTQIAHDLYCGLVEQSREPVFYERFGVEDSLEGRLDLILLHMFLTIQYLKNAKGQTQRLIQILQEVMIRDIDRSLREIGVGDMNVGKQMKGVGASLLGRLKVYTDAMNDENPDVAFRGPIEKNIYRSEADEETVIDEADVSAIVSYVTKALSKEYMDKNIESYSTGNVDFPEIMEA